MCKQNVAPIKIFFSLYDSLMFKKNILRKKEKGAMHICRKSYYIYIYYIYYNYIFIFLKGEKLQHLFSLQEKY